MTDTPVLDQLNRDAGDEYPPADEESGLQSTPPKETNGCGAIKSRYVIQWIPSIFVFISLVLAVWALAVYPSLYCNSTQPSGSHSSSVRTPDNFKERTHVYYTDERYLKTLPDNLDEYCRPKIYDGSAAHVNLLFQCPGTQWYIPQRCLCDYNTTCLNVNNATTTQTDHYRKRKCKTCTDKDHCPCQNSGKCRECSAHNKSTYVRCDCIPGTNGTYCTKITKRHCTLCEKINGLENCMNSNNPECFVQLNNNKTFICNWTETMGDDYPNCGQSISATKEGLSESEAPQYMNSAPQLKTLHNLSWAIFVLLLLAVILSSYEKFRKIVKKCCKSKA
ncbi:uncharacterized protein LOC127708950 isoform X3 [Mytilus californianus]|uniref:uncharacterized protein LOC127708950 isoform X3 n=1 Tax=Mytilus californianus TaxID=6549 RepID=UPI0022452719|nr:uncharacterized protein LOC127708950 isoform X3 [Mytilus californianus]